MKVEITSVRPDLDDDGEESFEVFIEVGNRFKPGEGDPDNTDLHRKFRVLIALSLNESIPLIAQIEELKLGVQPDENGCITANDVIQQRSMYFGEG